MELLDRLYRRDEVAYAVAWIVAYVALTSFADGLSQDGGTAAVVTAPVLAGLSALLWAWFAHAGLRERYGFRPADVPASGMLFYLPLALVACKKLLPALGMAGTALEAVLFVVKMLCVGFLEEAIFRGLLFRAIERESRTRAIVISSVTFGLGHIVNLFNASAQDLAVTLAQIVFALGVGFALVLVLLKSGSIWPCVVFHGANNVFTFFESESAQIALFGSESAAALWAVGTSVAILGLYIAFLLRLPDAER